jgi:MFS-type transporter involved in bile tolerance (Atg22 family)
LSYNLCVSFWYPALPHLARNTSRVLKAKQEHASGDISKEEFEVIKTLERSRIANFSFGWLSIGNTLAFVIALGIAFAVHANDSGTNNLRAANISIGMAAGLWILTGSPWFFLEKQRAPKLPKGETYFRVGAKAYWQAIRHANKLSQTWLFLIANFVILDGAATTAQLFSLCQNSIVQYSTTISTELFIVQGIANAVGIVIFWLVQKHWKIRTKPMFVVVSALQILLAVWGCIGIGTTKFGLHNIWEVWAYSVVLCIGATPFNALSIALLSDICPKGREVTFFAIFSLASKSTSWVGPIVSSAIIDRTGSVWTGFPFSLALVVVGFVLLCFVDVEKGQQQCREWLLSDPTLVDREE